MQYNNVLETVQKEKILKKVTEILDAWFVPAVNTATMMMMTQQVRGRHPLPEGTQVEAAEIECSLQGGLPGG